MSGVSWGNGRVEFSRHRGGSVVVLFENDGIIWVDAEKGIYRAGWQQALEPYEGPGWAAMPQDEAIERRRRLTTSD